VSQIFVLDRFFFLILYSEIFLDADYVSKVIFMKIDTHTRTHARVRACVRDW